ncbi:tripartite tricarboxylate transporter substrate binding protein [Aquincola sp. MAHUQ-54]|uniref:Tripartite tricarboxylate transporter substrate binding protein n=1 Tax=Aquincola agrisoli TaxID=3119538 RepID=A0AAW9Q8H4_9BURK
MLSKIAAACAFTLGAVALSAAHAQAAWPNKTIRLVVPYSAGGPTDAIARLVARQVGAALNQTIVVDNKAGAGGTIGVNDLARSAPDGYTFALVAPGPLAGMPNLMKVPYAPTDVQYLTLVARIPSVIVAGKDVPVGTLPELVAAAKAAPDKFNYSSAGPGTTPHIGFELLKQQAQINVQHVPYKGAAPAVTGVLGGEVQFAMVDLLPVLPHVKAGTLKVLAVAGDTRAPQAPQVPTTKELGLPGVKMDTLYGVIAPKGLPADIQKKFRDAVVAAVQSPELKNQFLEQGAVALTSTPEEYRKLMQAESDKWREVVSKGHITLE